MRPSNSQNDRREPLGVCPSSPGSGRGSGEVADERRADPSGGLVVAEVAETWGEGCRRPPAPPPDPPPHLCSISLSTSYPPRAHEGQHEGRLSYSLPPRRPLPPLPPLLPLCDWDLRGRYPLLRPLPGASVRYLDAPAARCHERARDAKPSTGRGFQGSQGCATCSGEPRPLPAACNGLRRPTPSPCSGLSPKRLSFGLRGSLGGPMTSPSHTRKESS